MRTLWMLGAAAALALAAAGCAGETDMDRGGVLVEQVPPSPGGSEVDVSMTQEEAEQIATQQAPGRVLESELLRDDRGATFWAVTVHVEEEPEVLSHRVYVDPMTRRVARVEDRAALEAAELPIMPEQARDVALARMTGQVEDIQAVNLDGRAVYEVHMIGRNNLHRIMYVDATTGEFIRSVDLLKDGQGASAGSQQQDGP